MKIEDCQECLAYEYRKRVGKHTSAQNYYCKIEEKRIYRVKVCPIGDRAHEIALKMAQGD